DYGVRSVARQLIAIICLITALAGDCLVWKARSAETLANTDSSSSARFFAFRLQPGQDLRTEILAFARREGIRAGSMVTCVGSLTTVKLRLADRSDTTTRTGHFEIVSLVGTLDPAGGHVHLCVTDGDGTAFGGHLSAFPTLVRTNVDAFREELTDLG